MQSGTLQRLIAVLADAFEALGAEAPGEQIEELAILVHQAMATPARHYHTLEHVFKFLDPADPILNLTALFHDIIYHQVDMGFLPAIWETISPYVEARDGELFIASHLPPDDRLLWFTLDLFELEPDQSLTSSAALSEFLSAVVMIKKLAGLVPEKDLLRMVICIETTVPFRKRPAHDACYLNLLEGRLVDICARRQIPLPQDEIEAALKFAAVFANKDIDSFAEGDPGKFLDSTWKLLPETNVALRSRATYTVRDFRQALQKMETFLNSLDPDNIFSCYRGSPPPEVFELMMARAHQNLGIAREYLQLKWLAMAVVEALAEASGGDAPLSLFMGDMPKGSDKALNFDDLLPEVELPGWVDPDAIMYKLLAVGRVSETSFDVKNSPLALLLYTSLPPSKIAVLLAQAQEMFAGRLRPEDLLAQIDRRVVVAVAKAAAAMAPTRREKLLKFTR
jgi:hypothetical protein